LLFWFQADVWAQRVTGGKAVRKAAIQCQKNKTGTVQGLQTSALFPGTGQMQTADLHGTRLHTLLTKFYVL